MGRPAVVVGPGGPRRVLVTRPPGRGDSLVAALREAGLEAEHHPLVELTPALEGEPGRRLTAALRDLAAGAYSHLVITSRTAVDALLAAAPTPRLTAPRLTAPRLIVAPGTRVVAVGAGTASALTAAGAPADLVAAGSGAALVAEMPPASPGDRVLFPASEAAAPTVPEGLAAAGYRVDQLVAYRPTPRRLPAEAHRALRRGEYAALVLTSPLIARTAAAHDVPATTRVVTIGEPTTRAARAAGLRVDRQSAHPTDPDLVRAVLEALAGA